jgi:mannitol/fructose-specific phosphotransferase system IIA component (Ntr-type)
MNLMDGMRKEYIRIGSDAGNKKEVIGEIARLVSVSPALSGLGESAIRDALTKREQIGSTAFGNGIAIPHCSLDEAEDFVVGVLVVPQGVDFESLDGKPTKLFFFIVGPKSRRIEHIQILSTISKLMKTPDLAEKLMSAISEEEVAALLGEIPMRKEEAVVRKDSCLFVVFIQRDEYFDDILQVFTAAVKGSITVMEANSAGYYLHKMPLFASFWTEQTRTPTRVIMAVVDKDLSNDVIRRISLAAEDMESKPGVLVSVQDLSYTAGSIEF